MTVSDPLIRSATYDDAKHIKAVANSHPYTKHFSHPAYCNRPNFAAGNVLVAVIGDTIVGMCSIKTRKRRSETEIDIICVAPEWRSHGIGAQLLDYVRAHTSTLALTLSVQTDNTRAVDFYTNYGFETGQTITIASTQAYRMRFTSKRGVLS